jgi:hypothetical protein
MSGVDEAALEVRFTSTEQGEEAEPHVLAALHNCAGFASEHAYLVLFDWAIAEVDSITIDNNREVCLLRKQRFIVIIASRVRITHSSVPLISTRVILHGNRDKLFR